MLLSKKSSQQQIAKEPLASMSKTLSLHAMQANNNKVMEQNLLNKLLRPPVKKQSKSQVRKYDPQFEKPDVEKLIHENLMLKQEIAEDKKVIMELKFKSRELEKKVSKLEENQNEQLEEILEKKKKNPSVHTEILKRKMHELHIKYIEAEAEIKKLKKLPNASIYQQNNIEKQHLLAETIRLKSILASYVDEDDKDQNQDGLKSINVTPINTINNIPAANNAKFQQQFLRMLKEENEKLKATIRLLENDKILMKSRQTTQNKQSSDIKKQLDMVKNKLIMKDAEIQKLINENKNLLFKKATQFRLQKDEKQSKMIQELTRTIEQLRSEKKKISDENQELLIDNLHLKEKQKNKAAELMQREQQLEKIKTEAAEIRNQYEARIKSLQMNKLHSKDSAYGLRRSSKSRPDFLMINSQNSQSKTDLLQGPDRKQKKSKFNWGKPVKFQQIDFALAKMHKLKQQGLIDNYQEIIHYPEMLSSSTSPKTSLLSFEQLYTALKSAPLCLHPKHSMKLCKYIFSDHSHPQPNGPTQQPIIQLSLVVTIIKASINQYIQCLNNENVLNSWKCFLSKGKKMVRELEDLGKDVLSKDEFVEIMIRHRTSAIDNEEINFIVLNAFSEEDSIEEIKLHRNKILQCMYILMGDPKYIAEIFAKSNFTSFATPAEEEDKVEPITHGNVYSSKFLVSQFRGNNRPLQTNSYYRQQARDKPRNMNKSQRLQEVYGSKLSINGSTKKIPGCQSEADSLKTLHLEKVVTQSDDSYVNIKCEQSSKYFEEAPREQIERSAGKAEQSRYMDEGVEMEQSSQGEEDANEGFLDVEQIDRN